MRQHEIPSVFNEVVCKNQQAEEAKDFQFDEGKVSQSIMNDFLYLEYSFSTSTKHEISINGHENEGFYFVYVWQGELSMNIENGKSYILHPHQSALVYDSGVKGIRFKIPADVRYRFAVICFDKSQHQKPNFNDSFYYSFKKNFCENTDTLFPVFIGHPYLKLLEKANMLSEISNDNVASELMMEGLIFQILGLKMEQLLEYRQLQDSEQIGFTSRELAQVHKISEYIRKNPSFSYSVDFLCRETGFSPSKLQEVFKAVHNRTVIDYIRNVRLEAAVELIKSTDMNISEIVYSIGLTSRSYFSKIFKNKYKCSPKSFQEQFRMKFVSA